MRPAFVGALVALSILVAAQPAQAEETRPADWQVARVVVDFGVVNDNLPLSACIDTRHSISAHSVLGNVVWRLEQNMYWCYDANWVITSVFRTTPAFTYGAGWRFGSIMSSNETGVGTFEYRAFVQAYFYHCTPYPWGEVCATNSYPWIQSILRGDGTSGGDAGH